MPGINRGTELIEHLLTDHQVRKRFTHALARRATRHRLFVIEHVLPVLLEWHGGDTDVVVRFEEQRRALAPGISNAVRVGGAADHRATCDLDLALRLQGFERWSHDRK